MIDREKWQRYIDDECTPEEKKEILHWLQELAPGSLEKMLEENWDDDAAPMPREIEQAVHSHLVEQHVLKKRQPVIRWIYNKRGHWAVAACILLLIGIMNRWLKNPHAIRAVHSPVLSMREVRNTSGTVKKALLPDGSQVWLTPQSAIRLGPDFGAQQRHLELEGEGYFEVAQDPAKPFTVSAGHLQTTVLGTHFNIESYPGEALTKISLSEGKIAVQLKDSILYLTPGTKLSYQTAQKTFTTGQFPLEEENAWKKGSIVFNDLPVTAVFRRLGIRFGKTFLFRETSFNGRRLTATYDQPDLSLVLKNMAFVQGFHYRMEGNTIIVNEP